MARLGDRGGIAVAGVLLLVAVALSSKKSPAATPATPRPSPPRPGPQPSSGPAPVPLVNTGGANWRQTRLAALARAGVTGELAISVLAQWDLETDGGRAEWNFNVGNVRPVGDQPRVHLGAVGFFRAYATVDEGVRSYLALVQSGRYTPCWGVLNADPTSDDWVRCLGRLGYYCDQAPCPPALLDTYAAGWRARRAAIAKSL